MPPFAAKRNNSFAPTAELFSRARRRSAWSAAATLAAIAQLSSSALGAATEPAVELPRVFVEESPFDRDGSLAPSRFSSEAWRARSIVTLREALERAPGLILQESFGGFEPPRLSIRGSGVQSAPSSRGVSLLQDGLPLGLSDGSFNSALLNARLAERIELHRGMSGWLASPGTLGGALDFITAISVPSSVRVEAGSFGSFQAAATSSVDAGRTRLSGMATHEQQRGWRAHSDQRRTTVFARSEHSFANGARASVSALYIRPEYDVPGPLTLAAAQTSPRSASSDVLRDRPRREAELWRVAFGGSGSLAGTSWDGGLAWQRTSDFFQQLRPNGISDSTSDDLSARAGASRTVHVGQRAHRFSAVATTTHGWRTSQRFLNQSSTAGSRFGDDDLTATTATLALEDTVTLTPLLRATLGWAHVLSRREIVDRMNLPGLAIDRRANDSTNLGKASLQWSVATRAVVYGGVAQNAEPATFDDLLFVAGTYPNLVRRSQSLRMQRATTWELGTRGDQGPLHWDVAFYYSNWRNEILRLADANGLARGAVNATPTLHEGVECSLRWVLLDQAHRLTFSARGVWSRYTFQSDPVYGYNRLAGFPPHVGAADLLYEHPRGAFFDLGLDWTAGRTFVDHANRLAYAGRALTRVRAGWRSAKAWSCFIEVQNLADRRHIASTAGVLDIARNPSSTAVFLPGNGRSLRAGIEWRK